MNIEDVKEAERREMELVSIVNGGVSFIWNLDCEQSLSFPSVFRANERRANERAVSGEPREAPFPPRFFP